MWHWFLENLSWLNCCKNDNLHEISVNLTQINPSSLDELVYSVNYLDSNIRNPKTKINIKVDLIDKPISSIKELNNDIFKVNLINKNNLIKEFDIQNLTEFNIDVSK